MDDIELNLVIEDETFFIRVDGALEEIVPDEHQHYVQVATIHGSPVDDEDDLDDTDFLYSSVGRIGTHYVEQSHDSRIWEYLGVFDSDEAAAVAAAGADFEARIVRP